MLSVRIIISLLLITAFSFSGEQFLSFSSCISIQDIEITGDTVWVASSGGIYKHSRSSGKGILLPNTSSLPDPLHNAICLDSDGSVWSGTSQGYLARYGAAGKRNIFYSYFSAKWPVTDLLNFGNYLIVGSTEGVSFFDKRKMNAIKSASKFNTFSTSIVNSMIIHNNVLYVGLDQGIAKLNISGGVESIKNIYDPGIWTVDTSASIPVSSFLITSGTVKTFSGLSAIYKGNVLHSDGEKLYSNNKEVFRFPSDITVIKPNGNECWIGTKENYFYLWDGTNATNYTINGMTCANVNRVFVDHASNVWLIPRINGSDYPWWRGIMSLQNNEWKLYNKFNYPDIGSSLGEDPSSIGITESRHPGTGKNEWKMWFGTSGGGTKCFIPGLDQWSVYSEIQQIGTGTPSEFYRNNFVWTKNDAIAQDSSGFIWISFYRNVKNAYNHHSLICYDSRYEPDTKQKDPQKAHFRWFFEVNDPHHSDNYTVLNVDKEGNIIAGGEDGKVIVLKHDGDPINGSVSVEHMYTGGKDEFEGSGLEPLGKVLDMVSTSDGITRIVTQKGVFKLVIRLKDPYYPEISDVLEIEDELGTGVSAIEAENESVMWLGVSNEGVVRYDLVTKERTVFGLAQGLVSTNINDLTLDRKNGLLWVATDKGISRLSIGYRFSENSKSSVLVYPNPFSKKRHSMIHFKNLPFGSSVVIHDLGGKLVGKAKLSRESTEGSYYTWTPSPGTVPGTYFYSIHGEKIKKAGKFIITP